MRGNRRGSAKQYSNETLRGGNPSALVPARLKTSQKSPAGASFSGTLDDRRGRGPTVPKPNPPGDASDALVRRTWRTLWKEAWGFKRGSGLGHRITARGAADAHPRGDQLMRHSARSGVPLSGLEAGGFDEMITSSAAAFASGSCTERGRVPLLYGRRWLRALSTRIARCEAGGTGC
jgi:hypothetical protein